MANNEWLTNGVDGLHFWERLGDLMSEKGVNQKELADAIGIQQSRISVYLNGTKTASGETRYESPGVGIIIAFANYFSVSTDYLLGLTDVKTSNADVQFIVQKTGLSEKNITLLRSFTKPYDKSFDDQCDSNQDASAAEIISDYAIYEPDAKYAIALVNDFIEFAFASDTIPDIPFERYRAFRQQIEKSHKNAQEWNELTETSEQVQYMQAACDANNSALTGGLVPFTPGDAAILFRRIFCDDFSNYLNSKYPASKHPLNFGWISGRD